MNWGRLLKGAVKTARVLGLDRKLKGVLSKLIDKAFSKATNKLDKSIVKAKKDSKDLSEAGDLLHGNRDA